MFENEAGLDYLFDTVSLVRLIYSLIYASCSTVVMRSGTQLGNAIEI